MLYFCHWICTDCYKNWLYGNHFCTKILLLLFSSLSLLLPLLLLCCFYCCCLRDFVSVLLAIVIGVCLIVAAIVVIFVALLLLLRHSFVLFNTYYVSSLFSMLSMLLFFCHCHLRWFFTCFFTFLVIIYIKYIYICMITSIHGNLTRNVEMSKSDFSIFGTEIVRVRCVTFFGLDVLGNSLSFVGVFYHFYCYCCCCCCIYALLSTNYIGLPSYYFITFHYFPTSLLLFRAIDCLFFCLLFRFYRLFCTSHLLPLNIIDF